MRHPYRCFFHLKRLAAASATAVLCITGQSHGNDQTDSAGMAAARARFQHLSVSVDTTGHDTMTLHTLDSAQIIQPVFRQVLQGNQTMVSVNPRCSVDSVTIFVRHSYSQCDTLARLSSPPYSALWDFSSLPDQDQIHLQFGYKLHTPGGKTIISKALPHNWAIDRTRHRSRKTYHCRQTLTPDTIIVDGSPDEWKKFRRGRIGNAGSFAFTWTNAALYFAAWIRDDTITTSDFIEVNLDPYLTGTSLSDDRHRSIRFGPASRSYCFIAHPGSDSTMYVQCDSLAALLGEGMQWRVSRNDTGYTLEAMLPFYALSDLDFPSLRTGLDVCCKTKAPVSGKNFYSWAGCSEYNRYNPSEWGVLVLHQAMLPLKLTIFISGALFGIFCLVIVAKIVYHFIRSERIEELEHRGISKELEQLQEYIDQNIAVPGLSPESAARSLGMREDDITALLRSELDCDFGLFVDNRRIARAKRDLWNFSLPIETVAANAGFRTPDAMKETFRRYLHTDPERYRLQATEMAAEDADSEPQTKETPNEDSPSQSDIPS